MLIRSVGLALVAASLLSACAGIRDHRGFVLDEQLTQSVQVGVDNRESVAKALGRPTFTGQFGDSDWYYVSQDTKHLAFSDPRVTDATVLHVRFDAAGNVIAVDTSDETKIASVDPMSGKTPTAGQKRSLIEEIFGNIGTVGQAGLGGSSEGQ